MQELLGGDDVLAERFRNGHYATVYLSPRDYHRVHMPATGVLRSMVHVPGRLFSVAAFTVRALKKLFARNERVVAVFDTEHGPMAVVLPVRRAAAKRGVNFILEGQRKVGCYGK